jgi:hypothetical protein
MREFRYSILTLALAAVAILPAACKSSGVAVTGKGQIINIDIDVPQDLTDGATEELEVRIKNRGVNTLQDAIFEVELPRELVVLSTVPGRGINASERMDADGDKIFVYDADDIEPLNDAVVRYHVRASFNGLDRSGDIKVTAWAESLPGDRLVETKFIKLRR